MAAISDRTNNFGVRLCHTLGLDPSVTKDIIITCMVDEPVTVYTTQYFQQDDIDALLRLLKKVSPTFAERERTSKPKFPADRIENHKDPSKNEENEK